MSNRGASILERAGLIIALAAAVLKTMVAISGFPSWELDPFTLPAPSSGLGPAGAMLCDFASVAGVLVLLVARRLGGAPWRMLDGLLCAGGCFSAIYLLLGRSSGIGDQWIESAWLAAMMLGLGAASVTTPRPSDHRSRASAIIAAVFLGLVALLAVRGAQQVLIEHPATLADFKRNREAIFAAEGWSPDSPMARAYERRLSQAEATGWFGLANVYATFAATGAVMGLIIFVGALATYRRAGPREVSPGLLAGAIIPVIAGAGGLVLAGAKGGIVAAALGTAIGLALATIRTRWRRASLLAGLVTTGALGATMALIVVRGVVGDRLSELSLLFRWFYLQAAVRIGVDHLPLGVGPDGFQQAYMLAKNPLSPEDVTSSHNMLLDWFATLGIFGVAWIILWVLWIWRAGTATPAPEPVQTSPDLDDSAARSDRWAVAGVGTLATLIAIRIERNILSPDMALTRIAGLIVFCAAGWIVLTIWPRVSHRCRCIALAAGGVTGATHALIDVTGVWPGSCAMLAMLVGAAGGMAAISPRITTPSSRPRAARRLTLSLLLVPLIATWPWRALPWERGLRRAASIAEQSGYVNQRWNEIAEGLRANRRGAGEDAAALAGELRARIGREPKNAAELEQAVRELDLRNSRESAAQLEKLAQRFPREWKVRREASRLKLREASLLEAMNKADESKRAKLEAEHIADAAPAEIPRTATEWAWIALVRESLISGGEDAKWGPAASTALEAASKLAPYELEYAVRLMRLSERMGDAGKARAWAAKALELDANTKYDREIKGLSPRDRDDARRLTGGS